MSPDSTTIPIIRFEGWPTESGKAWASWRLPQLQIWISPWPLPVILSALVILAPIPHSIHALLWRVAVLGVIASAAWVLSRLTETSRVTLYMFLGATALTTYLLFLTSQVALAFMTEPAMLILAVMNAGYLIIASWAFYSLWSARRDLKAVNEHALHEEPSLGWVAPFGTFVTESIEETSPRDAWHFREQSWFWATDWRLRKLQDGWALIDKDGGRVRLAAECAESEVLSELTCGMKLDISIQGERHKLEVVKVPERPR